MSDVAIRVEGLSKLYRLGKCERYRTLRDTLADIFSAPVRLFRLRASLNGQPPTFWALKDVSFEVKRGEVIGIIGRNGAGKSTLLKILCRVTEPTRGQATIYGRVGSLLEVGTGFHPELTGRENIYMNGAILGMKNAEIRRRFDDIVGFAEVERFIDTPVKHYSSGMYIRLAFAVAAHLEADILLVDEVLAVGDTAFQKKCIGTMHQVAQSGRTVVFVSHNLGVLANLCSKAVLLADGQKQYYGPVDAAINKYISSIAMDSGEVVWQELSTAPGNEKVRLLAVRILSNGSPSADVDIDKPFQVQISFRNYKEGNYLSASLHIVNQSGVAVLATANFHSANLVRDDWFGRPFPAGDYQTVCTIPGNFLNDGGYSINVVLLSNVARVEMFAENILQFSVHDTGAMRKEWGGHWIGVVRPRLAWETSSLDGREVAYEGA